MKQIEVIVTKWQTEDGCLFDTEYKAKEHEKKAGFKAKYKEFIESISVDLPEFPLFRHCKGLMDCGYLWFQVNSEQDKEQLIEYINTVYDRHFSHKMSHLVISYPNLIGFNPFTQDLVTFDILSREFEHESEIWSQFVQFYHQMDPEKD